MEKRALAALFAAGLDHDYAGLVADDSPIRIWRLTRETAPILPTPEQPLSAVATYQIEVPLTIGQAWSSQISERLALRVKAALDRAGVGYLTELG
jgi:hypothetical protein